MSSLQVPDEEPGRGVPRELRDAGVPAMRGSTTASRIPMAITPPELDGGRGEPVRRALPGSPDQPEVHVPQSAGLADKDQRRRCGRGRPQDSGNVVEREFAFQDAAVEALGRP
jgi:hypothetical protein